MYKIVNVTDKDGNVKQDFMDELKSNHPNMTGNIIFPEYLKISGAFCLQWSDDTNRMLQTSSVEKYEDNGDKIKVVARNSIYYLEKVEE